jgi:hypothetical protein
MNTVHHHTDEEYQVWVWIIPERTVGQDEVTSHRDKTG